MPRTFHCARAALSVLVPAVLAAIVPLSAQESGATAGAPGRAVRPFLSSLAATRSDPVYTTYAAALERSEFRLDEGYHLRFDDPAEPLEYTTDTAGDWGLAFRVGDRTAWRLADMAAEPVITTSYGDVVRYHYRPFPDLQADVTFVVHSSRLALQDVSVRNTGPVAMELELIPVLRGRGPSFREVVGDSAGAAMRFVHLEPADGWTTSHDQPHVSRVRDVLLFSSPPDCMAAFADDPRARIGAAVATAGTPDTTAAPAADDARAGTPAAAGAGPPDTARMSPPLDVACAAAARLDPDTAPARLLLARKRFHLAPGDSARWRMVRGVAPADSSPGPMEAAGRRLLTVPLEPYIRADERLYAGIPPPPSDDPARQLLYWSAFTLLRQVMLPPEGATRYPYYVFSREPQWGWGHGGQVFHESLSMLAYALMDPAGAMASQRVFAERQHPDGYIPYRVGPYLSEIIAYDGRLTTSAPWYAWESWEIFRITRDTTFLRDIYPSAARFYDWLTTHRDADGDGLYEWGGHAVLESVRDGDVAVWDQVGWPSNFEALDLNTMMVAEAEALDSMATALGMTAEAARWRSRASALRDRIERTFWDDSTGFYYHVDMAKRGFTHAKPDDLERREIIGFLPLWAGTSSPRRADRLIRTMTDPDRFWRPGGIPSLAADDPDYDPHGYWNGPVWVEWNYLVERGLLRYGRRDLARQLVDRVADGMVAQLRKSHVFWEMYGPDVAPGDWAGHHQVYIWAGLIARMMLDAAGWQPGGTKPGSAVGGSPGARDGSPHEATKAGSAVGSSPGAPDALLLKDRRRPMTPRVLPYSLVNFVPSCEKTVPAAPATPVSADAAFLRASVSPREKTVPAAPATPAAADAAFLRASVSPRDRTVPPNDE